MDKDTHDLNKEKGYLLMYRKHLWCSGYRHRKRAWQHEFKT